MEHGVVPSKMEGPVQNTYNQTNSTLLPNAYFVIATGAVGVIVAIFGVYYESFGIFSRRFNRSMRNKRKR